MLTSAKSNQLPWAVYNFMLFVFCIVIFWTVGASSFPDYTNYIRLAQNGYSFISEWIPNYLLVFSDLLGGPEERVLFYIIFVQVMLGVIFTTFAIFHPKASLMLALYLSLYLPFFMTTAIRASIAYVVAGILITLLIDSDKKYWGLGAAVVACFFHDSAIFALSVLLASYFLGSYFRFDRCLLGAKLVVGVCLILSFVGVEFIFDDELFGDVGRFIVYLDGGLNSSLKVVYVFLHVYFFLYLLNKIHKNVGVNVMYYCLTGLVIVSVAAVINQVVAIRLLPFVLPAGLFILAKRADEIFGRQAFFFAPFMLVVFLFNFWVLVQ